MERHSSLGHKDQSEVTHNHKDGFLLFIMLSPCPAAFAFSGSFVQKSSYLSAYTVVDTEGICLVWKNEWTNEIILALSFYRRGKKPKDAKSSKVETTPFQAATVFPPLNTVLSSQLFRFMLSRKMVQLLHQVKNLKPKTCALWEHRSVATLVMLSRVYRLSLSPAGEIFMDRNITDRWFWWAEISVL